LALRTKSIYEPKEEGDGVRLLITRFYPRGVKKDRFDRWVRELSPSKELLHSYRVKEKTWGVFRSEFMAEMKANPASIEAIRALRKESREGNVTLLCYERGEAPCHRYVVAELVKKPKLLAISTVRGVMVPEGGLRD
jgi:uncharacterized protein YeaO (DUF488 family)